MLLNIKIRLFALNDKEKTERTHVYYILFKIFEKKNPKSFVF